MIDYRSSPLNGRRSVKNALSMFDTGAATHVGMVRQRNEDNYLACPETGVWSVADGMGGHYAGDLASRIVVDALRSIETVTSAAELLARCEASIIEANARLKEIARERGGIVMGTTVAVLLVYETDYACLWSGDSRIYRIRDAKIEQISRDHTELEELVVEGLLSREEAQNWPGRNVITRAIGVDDEPELEMINGVLRADDVFVICSDGLTAHVEDREILDQVTSVGSQQACDNLIALTLQRGAVDNVTVLVIHYRSNKADSDDASTCQSSQTD
jgi:protein phosphatase